MFIVSGIQSAPSLSTLVLLLSGCVGSLGLSGTHFPVNTTVVNVCPTSRERLSMHGESNRNTPVANASINDTTKIPRDSWANLNEVRSMCPGAAEFYMNQPDSDMYPVKLADCEQLSRQDELRSKHRWLYGHCRKSISFCQVLIKVPSSMIVRTRIQFLAPGSLLGKVMGTPLPALTMTEKHEDKCPVCDDLKVIRYMSTNKPHLFLSTTNQLTVDFFHCPSLQVTFEAVKRRLDVRYTSNHSAVVTTWYEEGEGYVCDHLTAQVGHVLMVSFKRFIACSMVVWLRCMESGRTRETVDWFSEDPDRVSRVYNTSRLQVCVHMPTRTPLNKSCFKLLVSFHSERRVPQRLSSGLYNCSVDYYWRFQQHLDCNLKVECEDGRDEAGHCPFSSPACDGWVASGQKCYKRFTFESGISRVRAQGTCQSFGFDLASVKTQEELEGFRKLVLDRDHRLELIGLFWGFELMPSMYRHFFSWTDKTVIYNVKHIRMKFPSHLKSTLYYQYCGFDNSTLFVSEANFGAEAKTFICEKPTQSRGVYPARPVVFSYHQQSSMAFQQPSQPVIICPAGHVTHAFLSCDHKSHCGQAECFFSKGPRDRRDALSVSQNTAMMVAMYSCSGDKMEVSYSLLCDFRQDCADKSDESFCVHSLCQELSCTNGQCLSMNQRCDGYVDCIDSSDEKNCKLEQGRYHVDIEDKNQDNLYLIDLDGKGYFTQRMLNVSDHCPGTHYRCTKEWFYCLPIYTLCNGVFDCVFHEDESNCDGLQCPGLYRCRGATVCVLADHMCDGWPQCPQRDDEWLCDMTCPAQCLCQGHAFLCPQPFSAHLFPQLRYLDARGSGMTQSDLRNNTYIVRLSLAQCSVRFLSEMNFPNVLFLDLSYNLLTNVVMKVFMKMQNLQILILKWNPLTSMTTEPPQVMQKLKQIDLSGISIKVLGSELLSCTPEVKLLNISFSAIQTIDPRGFRVTPHLEELDMRGTTINNFPSNLFFGLDRLDTIYAPYYIFCCKEILPDIIPQPRCVAPRHYLSSCDDMIQSEIYRLNFWFVAALASLGNVFGIVCHCVNKLIPIPYVGPVAVFMVSLQCADLCMGMYSSVIVAAHGTTRGQYVHSEDRWTNSVACRVAGFLSLLSSEASVFLIFLLTLQHITLLCFPLNTKRFSKRSAAVACGVTCLVGILLASIPLVPGFSREGHYGQTAVCSLMLQDRRNFSQAPGFIHAVLVFNCFICLTVFVSLVMIYRATPRHRVLSDPNKNPAYTSADLLLKIAALNIARWMTITFASIVVLAGVAELEINVFMTVMVLPHNSAVNPLLCLWHAETCRRQQKREKRLLNVLKSRGKHLSAAKAAQTKEMSED